MVVKISVVLPVYNEKGRLENVLRSLSLYQEVIVVDDASEPPVLSYIEKDGFPNTVFLRNTVNSGYLSSVRKGIRHATGEVIITMDADGEHNPEDIDKLIMPIVKGDCDIVYGKRPKIARPSERILLRIANYMTGEKIADAGTGFRAIKSIYAKELRFKGKCTCGMLHLETFQKGMRSCEIDVDLPNIDKPRRIAWEHTTQFFVLLQSYIVYMWFGRKI